MSDDAIEVSAVMPCLNEEETIGTCVRKALETFQKLGLRGEVVVADNGSTNRSVAISESLGARVVHQPLKGYGNAYRKGFDEARGRYIVMADSDDSYDWTEIGRFVEPLRQGYELVMGTRLRGEIQDGAMPWLHRYVGNPVLTGILNLFFRTGISDAHCGMRAFTKDAWRRMRLKTTGMEFASEMVIKASRAGLKITEIPITLHRDGRSRPPHLRSFRDGWRHLRFMLMYSPNHLFLIPGGVLFALGMALLIALLPGPLTIGGLWLDVHVMVLGAMLAMLGFQVLWIAAFAKVFSLTEAFDTENRLLRRGLRFFTLETGLVAGAVLFLIGLGTNVYVLLDWLRFDFETFDQVRAALFGGTFMVLGVQTIFGSFLLSMLGIPRRE